LGCGTGLAGVAFRGLVRGPLDGCDLSPGMVAEAEKRAGLYRLVEAGEVVEWLESRAAGGAFYDLVLSADVLVYIGGLERLFDCVARTLRGAAAAAAAAAGEGASDAAAPPPPSPPPPPPVFMFSTEAQLGEGEAAGATFELSATGRCRHAASYIRRLAAERGLTVHAHAREAIRENAGLPVMGDLWCIGP
jgi:predicted TPR repeat methyltransferase